MEPLIEKRLVNIIYKLLILIWTLVGCCNKPNTTEKYISVGTYVIQESEEPIKTIVLLKDSNKFTFTFSMLSSYHAYGSYEENDGNLILKTDDGNFKYVFMIKDNTLIFNTNESSEIPSYANVPDGSIFSLSNVKLTEREPFIGIGYNLEYKDKIFPNMTDLEITEAIDKITVAAGERSK